MNYQMSLDPADQPLAIKNKAVIEDKTEDDDEDEEEELNSGSVALSGSVGQPQSIDIFGSIGQPVSYQNDISSGQVLICSYNFTAGEFGAGHRDSSCPAR